MITEEFPLISVIVVSFNTRQITLNCLRKLEAAIAGLSADVWMVDNGSTDGTVEAVEVGFPSVRLIVSSQNLGFGAANNLAMRKARGRYFLLLNSDAFPHPEAVKLLLNRLKEMPQTAVIGPRLLNGDGTLQQSCFRFPRPVQAWAENLWLSRLFAGSRAVGDFQRWKHDTMRDVDFVSGACMLVRREVYEQVGGFDEAFFMYAEEADWQCRMRKKGWIISFTPESEVTHLGRASGQAGSMRLNHQFFRGLDLYAMKHHGRMGLISIHLAMILGCFLRAMLWTGILISGSRRRMAAGKLKLHLWLMYRQATHWRVSRGKQAVS